jgi:two-component SAPR family response regulator
VLSDLGAEVVGPVNSLADGLDMAAKERLDGAILDLNLSGQQTYPLADSLIARGVPFVFITGYQRDSIDRRNANVPLLQKPIEPESLERVLISLLDAPVSLEAAEGD